VSATEEFVVGCYVKVHHDHPFAGLCVGRVVEVRPGRLSVEIRVPTHHGSRQDLLAVRPDQVMVIDRGEDQEAGHAD
jgi:hypothetical protein